MRAPARRESGSEKFGAFAFTACGISAAFAWMAQQMRLGGSTGKAMWRIGLA
jgi:hypothetical protein